MVTVLSLSIQTTSAHDPYNPDPYTSYCEVVNHYSQIVMFDVGVPFGNFWRVANETTGIPVLIHISLFLGENLTELNFHGIMSVEVTQYRPHRGYSSYREYVSLDNFTCSETQNYIHPIIFPLLNFTKYEFSWEFNIPINISKDIGRHDFDLTIDWIDNHNLIYGGNIYLTHDEVYHTLWFVGQVTVPCPHGGKNVFGDGGVTIESLFPLTLPNFLIWAIISISLSLVVKFYKFKNLKYNSKWFKILLILLIQSTLFIIMFNPRLVLMN